MSNRPDDDKPKPASDDQETVFVPGQGKAPSWGPEPVPEPQSQSPTAPGSGRGQGPAQQTSIKVGDCLNHIYEVRRFVARGGMGEVFEGINVTSDERVAIKVMLPSLADDPNVVAMFRREARAMTRLQHEALVHYRVLAQEPQLGVLYIVTDYIDGVSLCDVLETLRPSVADLRMLLKRLASGLLAAHQLGVLHRDISPDNVILESGRIESAKIVDFGIAKDLDPGASTIIGDGFAGKLGYVAPEQLGDFNRELGPWTDVYSLGLVIAAVASASDLRMGGTLVEAVDRRRAGADLTAVPAELRPVLSAMLEPDPQKRLRGMDEVIAVLDGQTAQRPPPPGLPVAQHPRRRQQLLMGAVGAAFLLAVAGWRFWPDFGDAGKPATSSPVDVQQGEVATAPRDPVALSRSTVNAVIPSVPCSWLDVVDVRANTKELNVAIGGVAGSPSAANSAVVSALRRAGLPNANTDSSAIATIQPVACAVIDTYRRFRNAEAPRLVTAERVWKIEPRKDGYYAGKEAARVLISVFPDGAEDLAILGIEPDGTIEPILASRADFLEQVRKNNLKLTPSGGYEFQGLDVDHEGWSGIILITGKGPFPADLVDPPIGERTGAWQERLASVAKERGWKSDMLWFKTER